MFYTLCVSLNALNSNAGSVFSNAAAFITLHLALGDISGGLFNPAVTLACLGRWYDTGLGFGKDKLVDFKTSKKEGPKYLLAQLVGAACGAAVVLLIYLTSGEWGAAQVGCVRNQTGDCQEGFVFQAFFAELIGTFFLYFLGQCLGGVLAAVVFRFLTHT